MSWTFSPGLWRALQPDYLDFEKWMECLKEYLAGGQPNDDLPLDIRATAFQLMLPLIADWRRPKAAAGKYLNSSFSPYLLLFKIWISPSLGHVLRGAIEPYTKTGYFACKRPERRVHRLRVSLSRPFGVLDPDELCGLAIYVAVSY
jgi:hypothetical protein